MHMLTVENTSDDLFLGKILSSTRLWKQEYLSSSSYLVLVGLSCATASWKLPYYSEDMK